MNVIAKSHVSVLILLTTACGGGSTDAPQESQRPPAATSIDAVEVTENGMTIEWSNASNLDFDVYFANEPIQDVENYTTYDGAVLLSNVEPPLNIANTDLDDLSLPHIISLVTKRGSLASSQSNEELAFPRYVDEGRTIIDLSTQKVWLKCSLGQSWSETENTCVGDAARLSENETIRSLDLINEGWRIPTEDELKSIVFCETGKPEYFPTTKGISCDEENTSPAVVEMLFPNTEVSSNYRTSTRYYPIDGGAQGFRIFETISLASGRLATIRSSEPSAHFVKAVKDN